MRTEDWDTILNDGDTLKPAHRVTQLVVRFLLAHVRLGACTLANAPADSLAEARDAWDGGVASVARHKLDAPSMQLRFFRARQDFSLDGAETVQDDSGGGPRGGIRGDALDRELSKFGRTARAGKLAHLLGVNGKRRSGAGKVIVVREAPRSNFRKYNAEREDVGRKVKLVAQEDFGGHVCVCAAKGETTGLFLVASGDARKSEIGDLETTVRSDE